MLEEPKAETVEYAMELTAARSWLWQGGWPCTNAKRMSDATRLNSAELWSRHGLGYWA